MDENQIRELIAGMMPDQEALMAQVAEAVAAKLPGMVQEALAAALASQGGAETDAEETEEEPDPNAPAKLDADPTGGNAEELALDADLPMEERADARAIEIVRLVERATGKDADLALSPKAMLKAALTARNITCRTDSVDRMIGALEAAGQAPKSAGLRMVERTDDDGYGDDSTDYNAKIAADRAKRSQGQG
jgi:hypothetical protein